MGPRCTTLQEFIKRYEECGHNIIFRCLVARTNDPAEILSMQAGLALRFREYLVNLWETEIDRPRYLQDPMIQRLTAFANPVKPLGKPAPANGQGQAQTQGVKR